MTAYVPTTLVGQQLAEELAWLPGDNSLLWYMDAIGSLFQETANIVTDQGTDGDQDYQTGYGALFTINPRFVGDTAICPTDQLPYTGQFVGVNVPPGVSDATARALITNEAGMSRGRPASIVSTAQRFLSGSQSVINLPRVNPTGAPDADWFILVVRPEQVISASGLVAAVNAITPSWLQWTLVQTDGIPWVSLTSAWNTYTGLWTSL